MNKNIYAWIINLLICLLQYQLGFAQTSEDIVLVNKIKNRITLQIGNFSKIPPKLIINQEAEEPAFTRQTTIEGIIELDSELFIRLKKNFKKEKEYEAALAFIIAHELIHHYDHSNTYSPSQSLKSRELEADKKGLHFARLADYHVNLKIIESVLNLMYTSYPNLIAHEYPSIEERLKNCKEELELIQKYRLSAKFKIATFLAALKKYEPAITCLRNISVHGYTRQQISNDIGALYLAKYLQKISPNKAQAIFKYPLTYDNQQVRTNCPNANSDGESPEMLRSNAEFFLKQALDLQPDYGEALVNKAILSFSSGNTNEAIRYLRMVKGESTQATLLRHIINALQNQLSWADAQAALKKAKETGYRVAQYNYHKYSLIMQKSNGRSFTQTANSLNAYELNKIEKQVEESLSLGVGNKNRSPAAEKAIIDQLKESWQQEPITEELDGTPKQFLNLDFYAKVDSTLPLERLGIYFWDKDQCRERTIDLLFVSQDFKGKTGQGISVGSPISLMFEKYGKPDPEINPNYISDAFYKYNDAGIMFEVRNNEVVSWAWFWEEM